MSALSRLDHGKMRTTITDPSLPCTAFGEECAGPEGDDEFRVKKLPRKGPSESFRGRSEGKTLKFKRDHSSPDGVLRAIPPGA